MNASKFNLTSEQQEWLFKTEPKPENKNPCVRLHGLGPAGRRCKECRLFYRKYKTYFKCELRGDTNGPGTDHRANWPACGRFVERKEP